MCLLSTMPPVATKSEKLFLARRSKSRSQVGMRGAPKISVLRGSECTVRVSGPKFRISVRFVLYIALSGLETHACKLAKCELKFNFASLKYRHSVPLTSFRLRPSVHGENVEI